MKIRRIVAALLAAVTVLVLMPFTVGAAEATPTEMESGVAFSRPGSKWTVDGNNYKAVNPTGYGDGVVEKSNGNGFNSFDIVHVGNSRDFEMVFDYNVATPGNIGLILGMKDVNKDGKISLAGDEFYYLINQQNCFCFGTNLADNYWYGWNTVEDQTISLWDTAGNSVSAGYGGNNHKTVEFAGNRKLKLTYKTDGTTVTICLYVKIDGEFVKVFQCVDTSGFAGAGFGFLGRHNSYTAEFKNVAVTRNDSLAQPDEAYLANTQYGGDWSVNGNVYSNAAQVANPTFTRATTKWRASGNTYSANEVYTYDGSAFDIYHLGNSRDFELEYTYNFTNPGDVGVAVGIDDLNGNMLAEERNDNYYYLIHQNSRFCVGTNLKSWDGWNIKDGQVRTQYKLDGSEVTAEELADPNGIVLGAPGKTISIAGESTVKIKYVDDGSSISITLYVKNEGTYKKIYSVVDTGRKMGDGFGLIVRNRGAVEFKDVSITMNDNLPQPNALNFGYAALGNIAEADKGVHINADIRLDAAQTTAGENGIIFAPENLSGNALLNEFGDKYYFLGATAVKDGATEVYMMRNDKAVGTKIGATSFTGISVGDTMTFDVLYNKVKHSFAVNVTVTSATDAYAPKSATITYTDKSGAPFNGDSVGFGAKVANSQFTLNTLEAYNPVVDATVMGFTATLGGSIGLNFHTVLSDEILADEEAYMQFTVAGETTKVPVSQATRSTQGDYYVFTCNVAAKQMTDVINAQLFSGDGSYSDTYIYTVAKYASAVANGNFSDNEKALANAMLVYGAEAQLRFNYRTDDLATADTDVAEIPENALSGYEKVVGGKELAGISSYGCSASLESTTAINFYFTLESGAELDSFKYTVNGKELIPQLTDDPQAIAEEGVTYCYVQLTGISAKDYDKTYTLTVTDAENNEMTVEYSVYAYIAGLFAQNKTESYEVAQAAYWYCEAAQTYFGINN